MNTDKTELTAEQKKERFSLQKRDFAMNSVSVKMADIRRPQKVSKSQITSALLNPLQSAERLQDISLYLKYNSGIYARLIEYFGGMLTFDYLLYPSTSMEKFKDSAKLMKQYEETALYLDKINVKHNLSWIAEKLFEVGEVYIYKIEDAKGIMFKDMPTNICRISSVDGNVLKYQVNLAKFSNKDLYASMPLEIQALADKYQAGSIKDDLLADTSWFELEQNAYAFNMTSMFASKGFPKFSYLFDGIMTVEELEQLQQQTAKIDNLKLIHQKIPTDPVTGELLMDIEDAKMYHQATKTNLPEGVAITTNPLEVEVLQLSPKGNQAYSHRADALESFFDGAGVNSEIFNGSKSTNEAVATGIIVDEMLAFKLINMFENFINYELTNNKKSSPWRVKILPITHFNRDNKLKLSRENLAFGGSRLEFMAINGYTPIQATNILKAEQLLGIDELLVPQQTSHTLSNGEGGSPSKQDTSAQEGNSGQSKQPEGE